MTHSNAVRSFVEVEADSHFSLQNLPYGVFSTRADHARRAGVAIGDQVLDLAALEEAGLIAVAPAGERVFHRETLNAFISLGRSAWTRARARIAELLDHDHPALRDNAALRARALVPMADTQLHLPLEVPGY